MEDQPIELQVPPEPTFRKARVALVIGNGAYPTARLKNPVNDAHAIARKLDELGFETIFRPDLDADSMDRAIADFASQIDRVEIALLFYAGHGLQVEGENYLVPIDAELSHVGQLNRETVRLQDQLTMMSQRAQISILLLDCCRDNPFVRSLRYAATAENRNLVADSGLAQMGADETLIAFATSPGNVAIDGAGENSPFTSALLQHLPTADLSIDDMMTAVKGSVRKATGSRQRPWVHSSISRRVILRPSGPEKEDTPTPQEPEPLPEPVGPTGAATADGREAPDDRPRRIRWHWRLLWRFGIGPMLSLVLSVSMFIVGIAFLHDAYKRWTNIDHTPGTDPRPDIGANAPGASASDLLRRLGDINAGDRSIRRTTTAQIEAALTGTDRLSDRDRLALATGLVRMASDVSRRGLSDQGRINLFYLLGRLDPTDWSNPDWVMVRAEARRALLDLNAAAASGQNAIGDQTRRVLDKLQPNIVLAREPRPLVINFSNQQFGGGITRDQAAAAQQALTALGWEVRGPDGSEATSRAATGRNEVRYDSGGDRDDAQKAALDLVAAGYPVMRGPVSVSAIGSGPIEVWLSAAPPADRWKAAPPKSAWCFQRQGPLTENGSYSVRCHKDAATCTRVRGDSPGERSSPCVFMPFLDTTTVSLQGGGTADSYFRYSREPFAAPFPALP